ncbi:MAG TPA: MlaD family protein [Bryobacteraceae bacterium]|nr:MlaD family protein [Bryobacteraceae bacterium]
MSTNVKVGIFIVAGVLLFSAGLFIIGSRNQVFAHHYYIYTEFANLDTLESGAKIRVSGMDAGEVSDVALPGQPNGKFRLTLKVDEKFQKLIRQDSKASIETAGMVGNKYVNIVKGTNNSPDCRAGCTIPSEEPFEIGDLMKQGNNLVKTAEGTITDIKQRADSTIGHVDGLIVAMSPNVQRIASNGANITDNVNGIVTGVKNGQGTVGKLLTDTQMAQNVEDTIGNVKQASTNVRQASQRANQMATQLQRENIPQDVHQTVANARDMSEQMKKAVGDFLNSPKNESTAENLRETIDEAHRATTNLAADTEAIKHNFFLRGFFHRRGFYNLAQLNPNEYQKSNFVKKPAKRIWLTADGMFTKSPNGALQLSDRGKAELDHAISEVADDLPNNPIMIEGYADQGSPADRYIASTQRAGEVKKYLETRFQLNPDLIGTIALEDRPPAGTGKNDWNGICLSLVVSRN